MAGYQLDDYGTEKSKDSHISVRCLVPNKIVCGMMTSFNSIQSSNPNAVIKVMEVSDCPQPEESILKVECNLGDIYPIFSQLIPLVYEGLKTNDIKGVREPELVVLFSSQNMGHIIGKGGHKISHIRKSASCFVKAFPNKLQNSEERVLLIRAPLDNIISCLSVLYSTVELDTEPYSMFNPADGASMPREFNVGGYQENAEGVETGSTGKKPRAGRINIRLLIPNKVVGGIIGKGGENIKSVRSSCPSATIKVLESPDCPLAEERVLQVDCDPGEIYAIFSQTIPLIQEGLKKNNFSDGSKAEICALFSSSNMGSIIGKGGSIISNLRTSADVFVKAFPNKLQNSDERILLVKGEVDKIIDCLNQIYSSVDLDSSPYSMFNPVDGFNIPREDGVGGYQNSSVGYNQGPVNPRKSGGRGGNFGPPPPFREPGEELYSSAAFHSQLPHSTLPSVYNQAPQQTFYHETPYNAAQQHQQRHQETTSDEVGGLLAKFIVKFPFSTYSGPDGESPTVKEVTLENSLTGSVIGDKGSRIRDVRATAGARIRIGETDSAGPGERLITIEGTNVQCHLAEYLLQCCVQNYSGQEAPIAPAKNAPPRKKLKANPPSASQIDQPYVWDATSQPSTPGW